MQRLRWKFIALGALLLASVLLLLTFVLVSPGQPANDGKGKGIMSAAEELLPGWKGCRPLSMELRSNMDHGHLEITSGRAAGPVILTGVVLARLGEPLAPQPDWDHRTREPRPVRPDEKGGWCWVHQDHPGLYILVHPGGINQPVGFETLTTEPFPENQVGEGKKLQYNAIAAFAEAMANIDPQ